MLHKPRWTDWGHGDDVFCDQILCCKGWRLLSSHTASAAPSVMKTDRSAFHLLFWKEYSKLTRLRWNFLYDNS